MKQLCVGFGGQISSSKTISTLYLVDYLNETQLPVLTGNWVSAAFGNALKDLYCRMFNVSRKFLEEWKRKDAPPPGFDLNIRKSLQLIGDDFRKVQQNIWVETVFKNFSDSHQIIEDVRYHSEANAIRKHGGKTVLVYRPSHENFLDHPSESSFRPYIDMIKKDHYEGPIKDADIPFDWFMINEGTVEDLHKKVREQLVPFLQKEFKDSANNF